MISISRGGTFSAQGGQAFGISPTTFNITGNAASINIDRFNISVAARATTINYIFDANGVTPVQCGAYVRLTHATVNVDGTNYTGGPGVFSLVTSPNSFDTPPLATNVTGAFPGLDAVISLEGGNLVLTLTDPPANPSIWDGDTDGDWSVATNWVGDVAPVNLDDLFFEGDSNILTNNDFAAGTQFSGINFTNTFDLDEDGDGFSLSGNSIRLAGNINTTAVDDPGLDFVTDTIDLDLELTGGNRSANLGEKHDLIISGAISEDGSARGLSKTGSGTLFLNNANSYTGVTTVSAGILTVGNDAALGTVAGSTAVESGGALRLTGGLTIAEPISVAGTGNVNNSGAIQSEGFNNLTGAISLLGSPRLKTGGTEGGTDVLTFSGGLTSATNGTPILVGDFVINNLPVDLDDNPIRFAGDGDPGATLSTAKKIVFNAAGNDWSESLLFFGGYVQLGTNDALPTDAPVVFGWSQWQFSRATLDLNGYDQTVSSIRQAANSNGWGGNISITDSSGNGTLTVNLMSGIDEYQGRLEGGLSLVKNGAGTLILNNLSSTTAPDPTTDPSPGPVVPNSYTGETVVNEGILSLGNNSNLPDGATVRVANGAQLDLNYTGSDTIAKLFLGGVQVAAGVYDMSDPSSLITGDGTLTVTTGPDTSIPNIIDIEIDGSGNVVLTLDGSVAGLTVQQSNDLSGGSFADVASTPSGNTLTVDAADTDPNADGSDFYRVRD